MLRKQVAGIWPLALWSVAATALLLFAATNSGLGSVQRRMLLSRPLGTGDLTSMLSLDGLSTGRVGGASVNLLDRESTEYKSASDRCRPPAEGAPPLPKLTRAAAWDGGRPAVAGNATAVVTMHVDRFPLLQAHCAAWPHTVMGVVYAPVSKSGRVVCLDEVASRGQLRSAAASWLGRRHARCQFGGWSLPRLRSRVRQAQKEAEETGICNLQLELWTEEVPQQLGTAAGLIPQASLQNKALLALLQQQQELGDEHAVVLLDSDMAAVDVWQLLNSTARWGRASARMGDGAALVLPAFQLSPPGSLREGADDAEGAQLQGSQLEKAVKAAMDIVTAEAGKFPLRAKFLDGKARLYRDHGFSRSQDAALPRLWFEAGDMHGDDDDGYPVVPQPGFAPFTVMRRQHVPWADERLRGSYYQRAWQALVARYMGLKHVVQPNTFTMQLPHTHAYSMGEAALPNFLAMEPVFRQLVEEMGAGQYLPVTSFGNECKINSNAVEDE